MTPDCSRRSLSSAVDADGFSSAESNRKSHYGPRGRQFVNRHGSKVHAYEPAKAPWPLSYDKATLELEMMDTALTSAYKGVVSLVDHKGKEPARCLDIGTGLGLWVTQSAKYWRNSTFVGFDLVDVQVPLSILDPDDARRIEWVYGNILTGPLPFDDEEFDHVRITEVALGIPENKWTTVFEEVRRVMKPGATIEIIEEDAIFPVLPRWFTEPLHARTRWPSVSMQDGSKVLSNPQVTPSPDIAHEYELLELLFNKVFDRRFVNTRPSSTLPAYFSTHFKHVISPPVLTVPMPPLPPVQPRPPPRSSQSSRTSQSISDLYDAEARDEMSLATLGGAVKRKKSAKSSTRSARQSTSGSPTSPAMAGTPLTRSHSEGAVGSSPSVPGGSASSNSPTVVPPVPSIPSSSTAVTASGVPLSSPSSKRSSGRASLEVRAARSNSVSSMLSKRTAAIQDLAAVSTMIGERSQIEMFPIDALLIFDLHSLCLHLRRSLGVVLAVREAMWEELQSLVTSPRSDLDLGRYGFYVHEDTMESMRAKYVQLLDQYKSDMHVRMSLWSSLVHFGWDYPQRDPMSKAEEMEELRLREDILLARRQAGAENEREPPCRAVRVLVGAKG
ncbi:hypothetical protein OH76DRAFT_1406497 [Lentinus brumalis]|uniref:Methyltransferase domain-containing protein n=1 Tax=Lentinus brumalis TaxID=2498619 RepID=A0A371D2W8_9APHY|nr:hypothetical protein OH76DRAFT_1406497 [Polyporus brumalis]